MSWLSDFKADLARYGDSALPLLGGKGKAATPVLLVVSHRELWALLHYRASRGLRLSALPPRVRRAGAVGMAVLRRPVEICSGIILPDTAEVGPGLLFAHPGTIVIHEAAVIGSECLICQGVTVGGSDAGVAVIGDRVYLATNAVVAGDVHVGDGAVVSANSLVIRDVPAGMLARGVPAENLARGGAPTDEGAVA